QEIVLGGKSGRARNVFDTEIKLADLEAEEQRMRVLNAVRLAYYAVLGSQETVSVLQELQQIAVDSTETSRRLSNIGQADETEVLDAEIQAEQAKLAVDREQLRLQRLWTGLVAVLGQPTLPLTHLEGTLDEGLPDIDVKNFVNSLIAE